MLVSLSRHSPSGSLLPGPPISWICVMRSERCIHMHGILISDRPLLVYDGEKLLSCVKALDFDAKEATMSSGETAKFTHVIMPLPEVSQLLFHCGQPNPTDHRPA